LIRVALARQFPICLDSPALIPYLSRRQPNFALVAPLIDHPDLAVARLANAIAILGNVAYHHLDDILALP
jgi:hypothetical protein